MNRTLWKTVSIATCVLALVAMIVSIVLGGCSKQLETTTGGVCYMKCYWCFRASALVLCVPVVISCVQAFLQEMSSRRICSVTVAITSLVAILFNATPIIGICGKSGMYCHTTALIVNILCVLVIILAIVAFVAAKPKDKKPKMSL